MTHAHEQAAGGDRSLVIAVAINVLLTVAQLVGGVIAGSLALVADALHNFNDAVSLALALAARRIARRPPDRSRTFGYRRVETVGALINLTALVVVGLFLAYEAIMRFVEPSDVGGWTIIIVAGIALLVDIATAVLTYRMAKGSLNVKAAFIHNLADALASVGVIVAGLLVIAFDWNLADPIIALVIAAYIIYQGIAHMRPSVRLLIDTMPEGMTAEHLAETMHAAPGVQSVHHLHAWMLDEHHAALEAHIVLSALSPDAIAQAKADIKRRLADEFDIRHTTLEFESPDEAAADGHPTSLIAPPPH